MEKFFNEEVLTMLMKDVAEENRSASDGGLKECCSIAESMIEEIHQIVVPECLIASTACERHKGSLRKKLLRQIRQAREVAML
jgi:hypothetical protein